MSENKTTRKRLSFNINNCSKESLKTYEVKQSVESEIFYVAIGDCITKWCLKIYPNGDKTETRSNIGFFLIYKGSKSTNFTVQYQLGISGKTFKENHIGGEVHKSGEEFRKSSGFGHDKFISHDFLFGKKQSLVNEGKISFFCNLTLQLETQPADKANLKYQALLDAYKKMFDNEYLTDFQLKTNDGKTLKVHKAILAARSPMFYTMLQQDMKETKEGVAEVPDFDSVVLKEMLRFVYYNEVENLPAVAHQLVYAANKYHLKDLNDVCVDKIISSITTENVLESLIISERVTETDLFSECLGFIALNIDRISSTEEWKELPNDILRKMVHELSLQNAQILSTGSFQVV